MERCNAVLLLERAKWQYDREKLLADKVSKKTIEELDSRQVDVFITFTGELSELRKCNLLIGHYDGIVVTGKITFPDLERLERLEGVTRISMAAMVQHHIDRSIPEIKASLLRSNVPPIPRLLVLRHILAKE